MPTERLPDNPDLNQLRRQAKELRDAVRVGRPDALDLVARHDPPAVPAADFPLQRAQLVLARTYGFRSWARLKQHCELVRRLSRSPDEVPESADPATEFLRLACLTWGADTPGRRTRARDLLAAHPRLARSSIHLAAACADAATVGWFLATDRALANVESGPFGWPPLCYLAYARHDPDVTEHATLATARALLAGGADPNAGFLWHGLTTPFTVLTGVFGEGEQGPAAQPRHPHATALAQVLLAAGADPNDGQALYNRMFSTDDGHLELLLRFGLGQGPGGVWHQRLAETLDPPARMVRSLLWWALTHGQRDRVALLVRHGADVTSAGHGGYTPAQWALLSGDREMVELLGVAPPVLDPPDALIAAIFAGDGEAAAAFPATVREQARRQRPGLPVWAAATGRAGALRLLVELGWDVNALGRGDAPIEQGWATALHHAAGDGDDALVRWLLDAGADPTVPDRRFAATPQGWAEHFGHDGTARLLAGVVASGSG